MAEGLFGPGNHGSTFGGNPLACAAGLATFDAIVEDKLMDNAIAVGEAIRKGMAEALAGESGVVNIRGRGLMIGIELDRPCGVLMARAAENGLLLSVTSERVVRLLPALTFTSRADAQTPWCPCWRRSSANFLANGLRTAYELSPSSTTFAVQGFHPQGIDYVFARAKWIKEKFKRYEPYHTPSVRSSTAPW